MDAEITTTNLEPIRKRLCADLKPLLIDLEVCSKTTGRKRNGSVRD